MAEEVSSLGGKKTVRRLSVQRAFRLNWDVRVGARLNGLSVTNVSHDEFDSTLCERPVAEKF